jgi:hypothetical protein
MGLLSRKISKLKCPECSEEIGIRCGGCDKRVSPERYSSGPNRYVCLCGHKCTSLECPYCHFTDEPYEFSCGSELSPLEPDMRSHCRMGQGK